MAETVFNEGSIDGTDFRVESDGNTHMIFVDGGNNRVCIGDSSPGQLLSIDVNSSTTTSAGANGIEIGNSNTTADNMAKLGFSFGAGMGSMACIAGKFDDRSGGSETVDLIFGTIGAGSYSEKMVIKGDGKVGIGTVNPTSILDVEATSGASLLYEDAGEGLLSLINSSGTALIRFDARSGEHNYINNGRLGIGETSPNNAIHVAASTDSTDDGVYPTIFTENGNATGNSYAGFKTRGRVDGSNNVDCYFLSDGANELGFIGTNTNYNFEIRSNGSTAMRFTNGLDIVVPGAGQNIYFGGTRISGEHDSNRRRVKYYGSGDNYMTFGCYDDNGYGYIENYNNSVGLYMFTGAAGADLIIDSYGAASLKPYGDEEFDLGESSFRFDDVYASNGTIQTSDERMKDNIKESSLGLDFINKLNPVEYKWKDYDYTKPASPEGDRKEEIIKRTYKRTHYGLIAQEVEKVLTDSGLTTKDFAPIIYDEDADRYGMRYTEMIGILIKGIQDLSEEIEDLKKKNVMRFGN